MSSLVASSRVGAGVAPYAMAPLKVDPVIVPSVLFGRHPGWGAPGGGRIDPAMFSGVLDGIAANGLLARMDSVLTGYLASPEQVARAGRAIDDVRAAWTRVAASAVTRPVIVVDPVMGDTGRGRYAAPGVAEAIACELVPRADWITPNLWELAYLSGAPEDSFGDLDALVRAARSLDRPALVTSVTHGEDIGAALVTADAAVLLLAPRAAGPIPNGTGDLLAAAFAAALAAGVDPLPAAARSVGAAGAIAARACLWSAPELPVAASLDVLTDPPPARILRLGPADA